ncbi:MAG: 16S rRNA (adenine(1518)-N(6)/adenine(1519)-N(6))-dimethyltransferase RsmA [Minisyncoccia bacterium]
MIHKAKKSLGQNFLKSEPALRAIVEAGDIIPTDIILEIGPGKGALTEKLLEKSCTVIAVEKDRDLIETLTEKFSEEIVTKKLVLIRGDILELNLEIILKDIALKSIAEADGPSIAISQQGNMCGFQSNILQDYKIIANIPYNITGAILKKFLTTEHQPETMVLMVQHEVAKRIVARDGKESILSISVKAYGEPKIIMKVPARYFSPAPKVDSAVIAIKNISRKNFLRQGLGGINEGKFWEIVKAGFAHKRKKLSKNLADAGVKYKKTELGNKRAEELKLEDWITLAQE